MEANVDDDDDSSAEEESDGQEEKSDDETDNKDETRDDVGCSGCIEDSSHSCELCISDCCHQLVPDVPAEPPLNDCWSCGRLMSRGEEILACEICGYDKCSECITK